MIIFNAVRNVLFLLMLSSMSYGQVYKCTVDGKVTFQSLPCVNGKQAVIEKEKKIVGDLNPSWFKKPTMLVDKPRCNLSGCVCGGKSFTNSQDKKYVLINAMSNLRNSWKSYQSTLDRYNDLKGFHRTVANRQRLEADACRIAVNQVLVNSLFDEVFEQLSKNHKAINKSHKLLEDECGRPDENSWSYNEDLRKWVSCKDKNRKLQNKTVRYKRDYDSQYNSLMLEVELLKDSRL